MSNKKNFRILQGKRAQITIFIIIGLVIVGAFAAYLFMRERAEVPDFEVIEEVPMQVKPIQDFVHSCLYQTAKDALILMGQHGGYVDMDDLELAGRKFNMDPSDPTESDAAFLNFNPKTHIAYWWFLESDNDCFNCIVSDKNKPPMERLEKQVDVYIKRHLESCLDDFDNFEDQGFVITPLAAPEPTTTVAENNVAVLLEFPLRISIADRTTNMTRFYSRLNLDLKHIYEFAEDVVRAEINTAFLEQTIKHVVSLNAEPDFNKLPPLYAVESSFVPVIWSKTLVNLQLQSLFTSHMPLIQLDNTKDAQEIVFSDDEMVQNLYRPFFVNALNKSYPEYSVRFFYLNWPIYFDLRPVEGDIIRPRVVNIKRNILGPPKLPFIFKPVNYYEFYYDISIPVIAEIKSYDEFFNETYTFFIAMEANIRDNKDMKEWFEGRGNMGVWDYSMFGLRASEEVQEQLETLPDSDPEQIRKSPMFTGNFTKSLFCNPKQRVSGNITIIVKNKQNGSAVKDAEIYYACGDYETCRMGKTERDIETDTATFNSQFPVCVGGGILEIDKDGFRSERVVEITTLPGENQTIEVELEPFRTKKVSIKKFLINRTVIKDSDYNEVKFFIWKDIPKSLGPDDMVMITFNKLNETPWEDRFSKLVLFYGNESKNVDLFRSVDLVPGKYTLDIQYFYTNKSVIPEKCKHICDECLTDDCEKLCRKHPKDYEDMCDTSWSAGIGAITMGIGSCIPCGECDVDMYQPEEAIVLENQILGGFSINDSVPWIISESDLDNSGETVEFYFTHTPLPRCIDDLGELEEVRKFYGLKRHSLNPKFI